jgi:stress-induced morphogen
MKNLKDLETDVKRVLSKYLPEEVVVSSTKENSLDVKVVSEYFTGLTVSNRKKELMNVLQYENKHLFGSMTINLTALTPSEETTT